MRARRSSLCACGPFAGTLLCLAATAHAAAATPFAAQVPAALPSAASGIVRVTIALAIVLAAVFGAAWLSRRMHGTGGARHPGLQVLAQLPLGPRERAVLIRVGTQQLLLGVTNGSVRTLHVLSESAADAGGPTQIPDMATMQRPTFRSLLLRSLGK